MDVGSAVVAELRQLCPSVRPSVRPSASVRSTHTVGEGMQGAAHFPFANDSPDRAARTLTMHSLAAASPIAAPLPQLI